MFIMMHVFSCPLVGSNVNFGEQRLRAERVAGCNAHLISKSEPVAAGPPSEF